MFKFITRINFVLCFLLFLLSTSLADQPSTISELKEFENYCTYYYLQPQPDKAASMLKRFLDSEMFITQGRSAAHGKATTAYFFARIARSQDSVINDYLDVFKESTYQQRLFILNIFYICGNEKATKHFKAEVAQGDFSKEKLFIDEVLKIDILPGFDPLVSPVREGGDLDFLWREFMVTGKKEPVLKILDSLKDYNSKNQQSFIIARVAEWSLNSFCRNHDRVMEICENQMPKLKGVVKTRLETLLMEITAERLMEQLPKNKLLKVVLRDQSPGAKNDPIKSKAKTYYRLGSDLWRAEKPVSLDKILTTIVKEPDIWIIQMRDKTGLHFRGEFPVNYHFPTFQTADGELRLRGLEIGTEVQFMEIKKAKKKTTNYQGKECILYYVNTEKMKVELICDKRYNKPLELKVSEGWSLRSCYIYDEYQTDLMVDMSLFEVPEDAYISEETTGVKKNNLSENNVELDLGPFIKDRLPDQLK